MRLPDATRLGSVRLQVADLGRSVAYYERVIGLRVVEQASGRATLAAHGDATPLIELHERPGAAPVPRHGRLGLYHVAILLPDRAALGRFIAHLGTHLGEHERSSVGMADHLVSEAIYLTDPDGLGLEVYADRPRSTWQRNNGEFVMGTEPLDVVDVARTARGVPWSGAPAGTIVGHVHLHVGDLDAAAKFYHETLGLDRTVWSYRGALFMAAGGYHHHLGTNIWGGRGTPPPEHEAQLLEWNIVLPDMASVARVADRLTAGGYPVRREGATIVVADPWQTHVRIAA